MIVMVPGNDGNYEGKSDHMITMMMMTMNMVMVMMVMIMMVRLKDIIMVMMLT